MLVAPQLKFYVQLGTTHYQKDAAKLEEVYRRATWKSNDLKNVVDGKG